MRKFSPQMFIGRTSGLNPMAEAYELVEHPYDIGGRT
jgi:hypothetical protein